MLLARSFITNTCVSRILTTVQDNMLPKHGNTYKDAIKTLNSLQTNSQYVKNAIVESKAKSNLAEVTKFLNRIGCTLEKLDKLSVIHIAGTNGKGSTCAYCESILRNHGYKTGFYSSPHLLDVRERIRINGKPISKNDFALHFWKIFDSLEKQKESSEDMPLYFRFLTILAFQVFLEYNVDVAIIETGIGGEYDCTNVLRKPAVIGITPLDLDHIGLLGDSIESIAWNKGGIMKENSIAFTTEQPAAAMDVLIERSLEKKCKLRVIRNNYKFNDILKVPFHVQRINASLALAISEAYITNDTRTKNTFCIGKAKTSIEQTFWPGRYEIKCYNKIRFFLDGAHTADSLMVCINWFQEKTCSNRKKGLIFNLTGDRLSDLFFKELHKVNFNSVIFTPNIGSEKEILDTVDFIQTSASQLQRCKEYKNDWSKIEGSTNKTDNVLVFPSVFQAIKFLDNGNEYDVLVTGSIHLVGAALSVLDPSLKGILID